MGILGNLVRRSAALVGWHPRDPALAEYLGYGAMTNSGVSVTADNAMRVSAVFKSVRILGESAASVPLVLYKRLPDGGKERATDHRLYKVVGSRPNKVQTRFEWIEMAMAHLNLRGVHYSRIVMDPRGGVQLIPLNPDRVLARYIPGGGLAYLYRPLNGPDEILLQEEVLRLSFMTIKCEGDCVPVSVIGAQREALGESLAAQEYGARFWANDAKPGTWIKFDNKFKDDEARTKFRKDWQEAQTGRNRHMTAVLEQGMELKELGVNHADAQYLQTRQYSDKQIYGLFRVPQHLAGDLERSTNNNIEHQSLDFVMHTMTPWFVRIEQALSRDLLREDEQGEYFFEFLVEGLLRGDSAARAAYYKAGVNDGWLNRNEVRVAENRNKVPGLDEFLIPANMMAAKDLGKMVQKTAEKPQQTEEEAPK